MLQTRINIGERDRTILFQERVISDNEFNEDEITGWQSISNNPQTRARVRELSGSEIYQADKLTDLKVTEFNIRYREDITTKNRIVYNGLIYDILTIIEGARRRELNIRAESSGIYLADEIGSGFTIGYNVGFL